MNVSITLFALVAFCFLSFTNVLPGDFRELTRVRFVPTLLSFDVNMLVFLVMLALLFNQVCYSAVYPVNVFRSMITQNSGFIKGGGGECDCDPTGGVLH